MVDISKDKDHMNHFCLGTWTCVGLHISRKTALHCYSFFSSAQANYTVQWPLNCDRFTGPPLNWLLNTVVGHSNYSTDVNSLGSTQGRGTQPKLFVKMASDDHVMGGSAAACPNQASPIAPLCLDNQRAALQAKVSGAIFGNYYLHNAPH
jgi:hypothetical protein